jgi:hypothetical protein
MVIFSTAISIAGCIVTPQSNTNGSYQPANNSYGYQNNPNKVNLSSL